MGENPPERMDFTETSALTGAPLGTLYTWVRKKQIPHTRLGPRTVVFERAEILRWMEARKVTVEAALG